MNALHNVCTFNLLNNTLVQIYIVLLSVWPNTYCMVWRATCRTVALVWINAHSCNNSACRQPYHAISIYCQTVVHANLVDRDWGQYLGNDLQTHTNAKQTWHFLWLRFPKPFNLFIRKLNIGLHTFIHRNEDQEILHESIMKKYRGLPYVFYKHLLYRLVLCEFSFCMLLMYATCCCLLSLCPWMHSFGPFCLECGFGPCSESIVPCHCKFHQSPVIICWVIFRFPLHSQHGDLVIRINWLVPFTTPEPSIKFHCNPFINLWVMLLKDNQISRQANKQTQLNV